MTIRSIDLATGQETQREYTSAELADIAANQPDPKKALQTEIESLERQQLMPRATREFMILFMETQFTTEMLSENPGYQAVKAFDVLITGKRSEMALL